MVVRRDGHPEPREVGACTEERLSWAGVGQGNVGRTLSSRK